MLAPEKITVPVYPAAVLIFSGIKSHAQEAASVAEINVPLIVSVLPVATLKDVPPDFPKAMPTALIVESAVTETSPSKYHEPHADVVPPQAKVPPARTKLPALIWNVLAPNPVNVPPALIVRVKPLRRLVPINPLELAVDCSVIVPPLLILIAVALPKPPAVALVPAVILTACATFRVPVKA